LPERPPRVDRGAANARGAGGTGLAGVGPGRRTGPTDHNILENNKLPQKCRRKNRVSPFFPGPLSPIFHKLLIDLTLRKTAGKTTGEKGEKRGRGDPVPEPPGQRTLSWGGTAHDPRHNPGRLPRRGPRGCPSCGRGPGRVAAPVSGPGEGPL